MLYIEFYSAKSFAVFGSIENETREYKDVLRSFNGAFNKNLRGKVGWVFGLKQFDKVVNWFSELNFVSKLSDRPNNIINEKEEKEESVRVFYLPEKTESFVKTEQEPKVTIKEIADASKGKIIIGTIPKIEPKIEPKPEPKVEPKVEPKKVEVKPKTNGVFIPKDKLLDGFVPLTKQHKKVPILETILFDVENNIIMQTDLETFIIKHDLSHYVNINQSICLDYNSIKKLNLMSINVGENLSTKLNNSIKIYGENPSDFPKMNLKDWENVGTFSSNVLNDAMKFVSDDELRAAMMGVYFYAEKGSIASTNGHYLYYNIDNKIERDCLCRIPKLLKDTEVNVSCNESNVRFAYNNIEIIVRRINERFPAYENVIPNDYSKSISFDSLQMQKSCKEVLPFADKTTKKGVFTFNESCIKIHAEDINYAHEIDSFCEADSIEKEQFTIGLNLGLLLNSLSVFKANVSLSYGKFNTKCVVLNQDNVNVLLMPLDLSK